MPRFELPDLAIRAPLPVSGPRVSQIRLRNPVEAVGRIEPRGEFQGKGFVMDEAVLARRTDRVLVQLRGVTLPAFDPRPFSGDQGGTVLEICRTMLGPELELAKMASHAVHALLPLVAGGGVITRSGVSEAAVELAFHPIGLGGTQLVPPQRLGEQGFRSNRGIKGLCIVACQEASLQLGDPIPELAGEEVRWTLTMEE